VCSPSITEANVSSKSDFSRTYIGSLPSRTEDLLQQSTAFTVSNTAVGEFSLYGGFSIYSAAACVVVIRADLQGSWGLSFFLQIFSAWSCIDLSICFLVLTLAGPSPLMHNGCASSVPKSSCNEMHSVNKIGFIFFSVFKALGNTNKSESNTINSRSCAELSQVKNKMVTIFCGNSINYAANPPNLCVPNQFCALINLIWACNV